jgi:hypothetical protein
MKIKTLLALCAIFATIVAVGCSNSGRTTAPDNSIASLNMPNGVDNNRFEQAASLAEVQGPESGDDVLVGTYDRDALGCASLQISKNLYVELQFATTQPLHLENGAVLEVVGIYNLTPGGRCQLSGVFNVYKMTVLGYRSHKESVNGVIR